jgi:hypothetical protein
MELIRRLGWEHLDDGTGNHLGQTGNGPYTDTRCVGVIKAHKGGTPMRISFHPSKKSTQPGMAFQFRMGGCATKGDVLTLALATQGDWCWMTDLDGHRIDREQWLAWGQGLLLHRTA